MIANITGTMALMHEANNDIERVEFNAPPDTIKVISKAEPT